MSGLDYKGEIRKEKLLLRDLFQDNAVSEFAVVKPVDENTILVAYKQRNNGKTNVIYKIIPIKDHNK